MESSPKNKSIENIPTRENVINSIKENLEDLTLLNSYMNAWEKKVQASHVTRQETEKLALEYALDLADIYSQASHTEIARDAYTDASFIAEANGWVEKYNEIILKIK